MDLSSYSVSALTRRRPLTPTSSYHKNKDETSNQRQTDASQNLKRTLSLSDIIFYGVGCSVGAGIYSLVGIGANLAGPSIALSFLLCGLACCFTSLSYAEFAARVPLAGSAYTFTYVSFGELCGWLVGWNLTLGYAISAAVVARSWSEYVVGFLDGMPVFQNEDARLYISWLTKWPIAIFGPDYTCCPLSIVIIGICTLILVTGIKESTRFNIVMTLLNLSMLGFVLLSGVGSGTINIDNLQPFFPHGLSGMAQGAGLVFFSYLGFDMVACLSEECKDPERNMPIGIIGSLGVSMSIYVSVSLVIVGMVPGDLLGEDIPITNALLANACCSHSQQVDGLTKQSCLDYSCSPVLQPILYYGSQLLSFGAIFGLTTATFACLLGQPRINYAAAQDGLICKIFAKVNPETGVPTMGTIITGIFTSIVACLFDLEVLANAISLGTLQVFTFVNAGVILLRMRPATINVPKNRSSEEDAFIVETRSPITRNPEAEKMVRSLGLTKKTSIEIRNLLLRQISTGSDAYDNGTTPVWLVVIFTICSLIISLGITNSWALPVLCIFGIGMSASAICLFLLPKSPPPDTFCCPYVPFVPMMGIIFNSYMMGSMPNETWKVISTWLLLGLLFYFCYGIHHSELNKKLPPPYNTQQKMGNRVTTFPLPSGDSTTLLLPAPKNKSYDAFAVPSATTL